jgi:hypothetical protein
VSQLQKPATQALEQDDPTSALAQDQDGPIGSSASLERSHSNPLLHSILIRHSHAHISDLSPAGTSVESSGSVPSILPMRPRPALPDNTASESVGQPITDTEGPSQLPESLLVVDSPLLESLIEPSLVPRATQPITQASAPAHHRPPLLVPLATRSQRLPQDSTELLTTMCMTTPHLSERSVGGISSVQQHLHATAAAASDTTAPVLFMSPFSIHQRALAERANEVDTCSRATGAGHTQGEHGGSTPPSRAIRNPHRWTEAGRVVAAGSSRSCSPQESTPQVTSRRRARAAVTRPSHPDLLSWEHCGSLLQPLEPPRQALFVEGVRVINSATLTADSDASSRQVAAKIFGAPQNAQVCSQVEYPGDMRRNMFALGAGGSGDHTGHNCSDSPVDSPKKGSPVCLGPFVQDAVRRSPSAAPGREEAWGHFKHAVKDMTTGELLAMTLHASEGLPVWTLKRGTEERKPRKVVRPGGTTAHGLARSAGHEAGVKAPRSAGSDQVIAGRHLRQSLPQRYLDRNRDSEGGARGQVGSPSAVGSLPHTHAVAAARSHRPPGPLSLPRTEHTEGRATATRLQQPSGMRQNPPGQAKLLAFVLHDRIAVDQEAPRVPAETLHGDALSKRPGFTMEVLHA